MKINVPLIGEYLLSGFKYLIAFLLMLEGLATSAGPLTPMDGALGFVYSSRAALVFFGALFFLSGAALMYGKVKKSKRWTGRGLMAVFCCFLFGAILESLAHESPSYGNIVFALIMAVLYLRWRFQTAYINPKHFVDHVNNPVLR